MLYAEFEDLQDGHIVVVGIEVGISFLSHLHIFAVSKKGGIVSKVQIQVVHSVYPAKGMLASQTLTK